MKSRQKILWIAENISGLVKEKRLFGFGRTVRAVEMNANVNLLAARQNQTGADNGRHQMNPGDAGHHHGFDPCCGMGKQQVFSGRKESDREEGCGHCPADETSADRKTKAELQTAIPDQDCRVEEYGKDGESHGSSRIAGQ